MYKWSKKSQSILNGATSNLQTLCNDVLFLMDLTMVYSHRGEALQNKLEAEGNSTLRFPYSAHNQDPSLAVDVIPAKNGWQSSKEEFTQMRELFQYCAGLRGYKLKPLIIFKDGSGDYAHIEIDI